MARRGLLLIGIAVLLAATSTAQPADRRADDVLLRRFLEAAYPELAGRRFDFQVGDLYSSFIGATLRPLELSPDSQKETYVPELEVGADVEDGLLVSVHMRGRFVNDVADRELQDLDFSGLLETPTRRRALLEARGARFGDGAQAAFERALDLARFEPLIGRIEAFRTEFEWPDDSKPAVPRWVVRIRATEPTEPGRVACYRMEHEVWNGRLVSMSRWALPRGVQPGFTPSCMVP